MKRRGFLGAVLAAAAAPAVVRSGILMPVKQLIVPQMVSYGGGFRLAPDDKPCVFLEEGRLWDFYVWDAVAVENVLGLPPLKDALPPLKDTIRRAFGVNPLDQNIIMLTSASKMKV